MRFIWELKKWEDFPASKYRVFFTNPITQELCKYFASILKPFNLLRHFVWKLKKARILGTKSSRKHHAMMILKYERMKGVLCEDWRKARICKQNHENEINGDRYVDIDKRIIGITCDGQGQFVQYSTYFTLQKINEKIKWQHLWAICIHIMIP